MNLHILCNLIASYILFTKKELKESVLKKCVCCHLPHAHAYLLCMIFIYYSIPVKFVTRFGAVVVSWCSDVVPWGSGYHYCTTSFIKT